MVDPKAAPVARNVPKRADTGRVDPTDYTPTDKVAPTPAVASGIADKGETLADDTLEVAPSFARVKKPTQAVVDTVKKAVETVKGEPSKRLSPDARLRAVALFDDTRMRAVKRFSRRIQSDVIRPLVTVALLARGLKPSDDGSESEFEVSYKKALSHRVQSGYRVKGDRVAPRMLTIAQHIAYTVGRHVVAIDDWTVDKWIAYPNAMDVVFSVGAIVDTFAMLYASESIKAMVGAIVDGVTSREPIKADARVSNAQ